MDKQVSDGGIDALMAEHNISVWQDPHWNGGRLATDRWLAGVDIEAVVVSHGCDTCGYGEEADIRAYSTSSGATPTEAVRACVAKLEALS